MLFFPSLSAFCCMEIFFLPLWRSNFFGFLVASIAESTYCNNYVGKWYCSRDNKNREHMSTFLWILIIFLRETMSRVESRIDRCIPEACFHAHLDTIDFVERDLKERIILLFAFSDALACAYFLVEVVSRYSGVKTFTNSPLKLRASLLWVQSASERFRECSRLRTWGYGLTMFEQSLDLMSCSWTWWKSQNSMFPKNQLPLPIAALGTSNHAISNSCDAFRAS